MRVVGLLLVGCTVWAQGTVDYARQVHPVLAAKCGACHSAEKRAGGLSVGTVADLVNGGRNGSAVKPGAASASLLVKRATGEVGPKMPLAGPGLTDAELKIVRDWIDQGARAAPGAAAAKAK